MTHLVAYLVGVAIGGVAAVTLWLLYRGGPHADMRCLGACWVAFLAGSLFGGVVASALILAVG